MDEEPELLELIRDDVGLWFAFGEVWQFMTIKPARLEVPAIYEGVKLGPDTPFTMEALAAEADRWLAEHDWLADACKRALDGG